MLGVDWNILVDPDQMGTGSTNCGEYLYVKHLEI